MTETWIIFTFLVMALVFVSGILFSRSLGPAVFCLFGFLFAIACIYASLSAHSATFAQILLYVGGVMVLVAFVLFLNPEPNSTKIPVSFLRFHFGKSILVLAAGVTCFFFVPYAGLNRFFLKYKAANTGNSTEKSLGDTGKVLASEFSFEFEMIGILMLAGIALCGWYLKSNHNALKK